MTQSPYLIVGLGNPDQQYFNTFHNMGFMALDETAKRLGGAVFNKGECRAVTAHIKIDGVKVILAKPITYMNLSGEAVNELVNKYKIERERFLVIYDDVDLPIGKVRIRYKGSAGTHNGMRNIVLLTGTSDFARIRIGINRPFEGELVDYVLARVTDSDKKVLQPAFERTAQAVEEFVHGTDISVVMGKYNG